MNSKVLRFKSVLFSTLGGVRQQLTPQRFIGLGAVGLLLAGVPVARNRIADAAKAETAQLGRILPVEILTVTPVNSYEVLRTYTGEIAPCRPASWVLSTVVN